MMKSPRQYVWEAARARNRFTVTELRQACYVHRNLVAEYLMRWTAAGFLQAHEDERQTFSWRKHGPSSVPTVTRGGKILDSAPGVERIGRATRAIGPATASEIAAVASVAPQTARHYLRLMQQHGLVRRLNNPTRHRPAKLEWISHVPVVLGVSATQGLIVTPLSEASHG